MTLDAGQLAFVLVSGALLGSVGGLLGIGGGILMAPALLFLPELLGLHPIAVAEVTGLTAAHSLAAASGGALRHQRRGFMLRRLVVVAGPAIALAGLVGGLLTDVVSARALIGVMAALATLAFALLVLTRLLRPRRTATAESTDFPRGRAVAGATGIGLLGGLAGQGGGFLILPFLLQGLGLPMRFAIGSGAGVTAISAAAALVGKAATGHVDWLAALPLMALAWPAGWLGAQLSQRISARALALVLAAILAVASVRLWVAVA